ncbi:M-phase inducer phosphatase isoform X2 [Episyrphus balteatus]|uniref:M-phase inducer phosphatase isoform X2 n=1 Tax=Episyrphus balteatus TaxID=286459 RepID=UPI002485E9E0|nr:M-phase inducer phosphatase isoform X2 [Episyrphus balteatus]
MSSRIKEDVKKLFEFWCEVTRVKDPTSKNAGVIIESFPENFNDQQIISKIPDFAYPCDCESESVETYSFVLTSEDSKWRFGFCRHDPKTETAMIIITYLPWHDTFLKLMGVLSTLRRTDNSNFQTFLSEAYNRGVPDLGGTLNVFYNGGQNNFTFQRPLQFKLPSIPDNHNLSLYYNFATPKNMISVFASMLAERRIIFTSRSLDKLSSCIQAANAFLYPMVWQHIFIPLLPMKLKDILSAPMPYLIGVPEAVLETMTPEELGEVATLNCDTKIFESPFDDVHEMPPEIISHLKKHLNNSNSHEHVNDRVSKIFLGVLVQLIGGYRDAVEFGEKKTFNRDRFIETRPHHLRPFLAKMMDLQIFQQFIDERLQMLNTGLGFSDEFELETVRYSEKIKKRGRNYYFLKNVKDRTNPAVKSAVKSVKEGSRGVKTAYKDLKSKFRDITPPNTNFQSHVSSSHHDGIDGLSGRKAGPHSAPSSPIFNKRGGFAYATPDVISGAATAIRKPLAMSSSNSKIQNGFSNCSNSAPVYNNHLDTSPTISPAGSMCSSEMNLSQELQNHPLFKSPTVDRSLKPSSSLDLNYRTSAVRSGAPPIVRTLPPHNNHHHHNHQYHNHYYSHSPAQQAPAPPTSSHHHNHHHHQVAQAQTPSSNNNHRSLGGQNYNNNNNNNNNNTTTIHNEERQSVVTSKFVTTDSVFDSPPNMMSPPVPPRRNGAVALRRHTSSRTERTWIGFDAPANGEPPVPAPRLKKEKQRQAYPITHSASHTAVMNDLISLDDSSSTSFDLEDFDPLNQNAKPLPTSTATSTQMALKSRFLAPPPSHASPAGQSTKSTTLPASSASSNISGVSNPLYPYFTPQHRSTLPSDMNGSNNARDDDFELLRKYGLDQFSFASEPSTSSGLNSSNLNRMPTATATAASMNNWTTFE